MLYIYCDTVSFNEVGDLTTERYETMWHIGQEKPNFFMYGDSVLYVQASGDELDFIKETFTNIPFSLNRKVTTWTGVFAEFIARNL